MNSTYLYVDHSPLLPIDQELVGRKSREQSIHSPNCLSVSPFRVVDGIRPVLHLQRYRAVLSYLAFALIFLQLQPTYTNYQLSL